MLKMNQIEQKELQRLINNAKPRKNTYQIIFDRLEKLGVNMERPHQTASKSVVDPDGALMDLHYDYLGRDGDTFTIALAHRFIQCGDSMADPDMEIRVFPKQRMAEALSFQQDSLGIYWRVYPEPGKVAPRQKKDQNAFLKQWLKNALQQGHSLKKEAA